MSTAFNLFTQNVAEVELTYKSNVKASDRPKIVSSKDAVDIFQNCFNQNTIELNEEFWVMYLNRANRVIAVMHLSKGGTTGTVVDAKFIICGLVKLNASSVILCHNHPSGNTKPSAADLRLTKNISEACKLIDCQALDHVIITPENTFYSFADEGMM